MTDSANALPRPSSMSDDIFRIEIERFRKSLANSRSAIQLPLFDFLVERANDDRPPKEVEIALAVFGGDVAQTTSAESGVRVYVHRLRRRLEDFYSGHTGPRLIIPKGQYRLILVEEDASVASSNLSRMLRRLASQRLVIASAALGILLSLAGYLIFSISLSPDTNTQISQTNLWKILTSRTPFTIVAGDTFLLAETEDQRSVKRMILDPAISSRDDLGKYLTTHPAAFYQLYDLDLHFMSSETSTAAIQLQGLFSTVQGSGTSLPNVVPMSALNQDDLKRGNIVFVGQLSDLGALAGPVFSASRFKLIGADVLSDTASRRVFQAISSTQDGGNVQKSFAYLASINLQNGRTLVVMAGLNDEATIELMQIVSRPETLRLLETQTQRSRHFESLFEIRTKEGIGLENRLLLARPLA